jgi:hypothetical protein
MEKREKRRGEERRKISAKAATEIGNKHEGDKENR